MVDGTTQSVRYGTAVQIDPSLLDILFTSAPNACPAGWFTASEKTSTEVDALWLDMWRPSDGSYVGDFGLDGSDTYDDHPGRVAVATITVPAGSPFSLDAVKTNPVVGGTLHITAYDELHIAGSIDGVFESGESLHLDFDVPYCTSACGN